MNQEERLLHRLLDIGHMMRMLYEGKASQKRILIVLSEQKGISQKELTKYLGIQPGSASEILAKLEKTGLIVRTQSEKDHRGMEITLTDEGEKLAEEAVEQRKKRHEQMFACLTEEEKETLLSLLNKLCVDWESRFALSCGYGKREHQREKEKSEGREN